MRVHALESAFCNRIGIAVPSGNCAVDGIKDWLGETPEEWGCRSKGSFCVAELADVSSAELGGPLHEHVRLTAIRTAAIAGWESLGFSAFRDGEDCQNWRLCFI